jgi:hypothetical protein
VHLPSTLRRLLCRLVFFILSAVPDGQPQVADFLAYGLAGDPKQEGGLSLTSLGVLQDALQQDPVQLAVSFRI